MDNSLSNSLIAQSINFRQIERNAKVKRKIRESAASLEMTVKLNTGRVAESHQFQPNTGRVAESHQFKPNNSFSDSKPLKVIKKERISYAPKPN